MAQGAEDDAQAVRLVWRGAQAFERR